jgi:dGTPase
MADLKDFMFQSVYFNPLAKGEEGKAEDMICLLFEYYVKHTDALPSEYQDILVREGAERAVTDYIAGMTDTYAVEQFQHLFVPKGWVVK